eukprot:CAMPEP_0174750162 /NCGR_PEP_ID=MMETSP1094-20130205/97188_1 /TAXON_ID=156173 /ORGANISM="Chrysochromulina brevifilum, Strain UTEX LB 985" /LENGTH=39 /DNA_ID= /DNA_START= /DNA_END= /DNA_ORIENTATION=
MPANTYAATPITYPSMRATTPCTTIITFTVSTFPAHQSA